MPLSIMIVEDEEIIALDLKEMLEEAGHSVMRKHATTMDEALATATKHRPQVAIVDIGLKGEDTGFEIGKVLGSGYKMPILFLTGQSDFLVRAMALEEEPLGYITKPYQQSDILDALARLG